MKNFVIPAYFNKRIIDEFDELNHAYKDCKVIEVYGNITLGNYLESGRVVSQLQKISLDDLRDYVEYCKQRDISFNYTINAPHMQNKEFTEEGIKYIKKMLYDLDKIGVSKLTVTLPSVLEIIQSMDCEFEVKASTLCQITNANRALAFSKLGMKRIVVDEAINRDFATLKSISDAVGGGIEVIANPICYKDCIYRMPHYNQISTDSVGESNEVSVNYYEHRCVMQRHQDIRNLLKLCWIRPEDLDYYTSIGVNYFKLAGRQLVLKGGDPVRTVKAYFDGSFDGDLMDLITMFVKVNNFHIPLDNKKLDGFIKPFYDHKLVCKNDCTQCNYCKNFSRKIIDYKKATEIVSLSNQFYKSYDKFNQSLSVIDGKKTAIKNDFIEDGKFDF